MMYIQTVYVESQWQALTQEHRIAQFLSQVNRISSTVGGTGRIYMYILSEEPDVYICIVLSQEQEVNDPLRNREYKKVTVYSQLMNSLQHHLCICDEFHSRKHTEESHVEAVDNTGQVRKYSNPRCHTRTA